MWGKNIPKWQYMSLYICVKHIYNLCNRGINLCWMRTNIFWDRNYIVDVLCPCTLLCSLYSNNSHNHPGKCTNIQERKKYGITQFASLNQLKYAKKETNGSRINRIGVSILKKGFTRKLFFAINETMICLSVNSFHILNSTSASQAAVKQSPLSPIVL